MYLIGVDHPNKYRAQTVLEQVIAQRERLVSDVEVLQEILHRYVAINRREAIQPAFDALFGLVDEIFPVEVSHLRRAKDIVSNSTTISARDALHLAVMAHHKVDTILSFDRGFDTHQNIVRIPAV